ncbi:DUF5687 family protein [candidate division KSB1 bacterium]|nr:DUF5687 family protein [candidate division KSB1 bacterium]
MWQRFYIFKHVWQGLVRSILWSRHLATNIFLGVLLLLLFINFLSFGLFIDVILKNTFPGQNHVDLINGILGYYLLIDFIFRFMLQKIPGLEIQPYLYLPVPRKKLVNSVLVRSFLSLFNIFPLLVLIPIAFKIILPLYALSGAVSWLLAMVSLILSMSLLHFYLAKLQLTRPRVILYLILTVVFLIGLQRFGIFNLIPISRAMFQCFIAQPATVLIPLGGGVSLYLINFYHLRRHLYLDQLGDHRTRVKVEPGYWGFFTRFGDVGTYLALELKLLLRNKRTRATFMMTAFMPLLLLFYISIARELDFYPQPKSSVAALQMSAVPDPAVSRITFQVIPGLIPPKAHVYLTGDHPTLGPWKPGYFALQLQPDSTWQGRLDLPPGVQLRYIVTLGSWETEAKLADGKEPDVRTLTVQNDTTVVLAHPRWKSPAPSVMVNIMILYMGLLMTGLLILSYGQFIFSWESRYFDLILSRPVVYRQYLNAKFIILIGCGLILFLLSLPILFFSRKLFYWNSLLFLYNIGVNSYILLFWATFTRKRMDLAASIFSTQGKGGNHFMSILPTFIFPIVLYFLIISLVPPALGFWILGGLGLAGLILHPVLMNWVLKIFHWQKYKMAMGFRQL